MACTSEAPRSSSWAICRFLRNFRDGCGRVDDLQHVAERLRPAPEVGQHALPVPLLVIGGPGIGVGHAVPQGVVEQHGDLARGGGDRLGLAHPPGQAAEVSTVLNKVPTSALSLETLSRNKAVATLPWDRRTIGGRTVLALNDVARAVLFGDCIRSNAGNRQLRFDLVQCRSRKTPQGIPLIGFSDLNFSRSRMLRPPLVRRSPRTV